MSALIWLIGILVFVFVTVLLLEIVWETPRGRLAEVGSGESGLSGYRRALAALDKPVGLYMPKGILRSTAANLYWAQMAGKWTGWNEVQFVSLQVATAAGAFVAGTIVFGGNLLLSGAAGLIGWQYPTLSLNGTARRTRRTFQGQLPEFIQLVAARVAAGNSLENALIKTAAAPGLAGQWMRRVVQRSQGRDLLEQLSLEAVESQMPELIGMATQLRFIKRGAAQQQLMGQLAVSIAADYITQADQRAEKLGAELVTPMVLFYFLPFLGAIMFVIGYPIVTGLF